MTTTSNATDPKYMCRYGVSDGSQVNVSTEGSAIEIAVYGTDAEGVGHWVTMTATADDAEAICREIRSAMLVADRQKSSAA